MTHLILACSTEYETCRDWLVYTTSTCSTELLRQLGRLWPPAGGMTELLLQHLTGIYRNCGSKAGNTCHFESWNLTAKTASMCLGALQRVVCPAESFQEEGVSMRRRRCVGFRNKSCSRSEGGPVKKRSTNYCPPSKKASRR